MKKTVEKQINSWKGVYHPEKREIHIAAEGGSREIRGEVFRLG
jgi:hypothetical protein